MDFIIALGHIVAGAARLAENQDLICKALGIINELALVISDIWYIFLAVDLIKAIRNPFR